ncbi:MAG: hypothetical protein LBB98_06865 [Treponema sp.]|nr:hypothetical protein [Treponema sp.]
MLVIIGIAAFCYGLVPVAGAFVNRRRWRDFRQRFNDLRLKPFLDYAACRRGEGGLYRFIGGFESATDGHTLWIRNDDLTIPIALADAHTYVLPMPEKDEPSGSFDPGKETPARINWDQVTALTEGAKVFVGGALLSRDNRLTFVSEQDNPLLVIFYDGPDRSLAARTIRAGRDGNEYWNFITPYALILGAFSQLLIALNFLNRPAFRLTLLTAFFAVFIPLFPMIPPGFVLTVLYKRIWWQARIFRAYRDLVRLPLKYLPPDNLLRPGRLPDGECYAGIYCESLPGEAKTAMENRTLPLIIPEKAAGKHQGWYIFGAVPEGGGNRATALPGEPRDVFATYGVIPGNPEKLARLFTYKAYTLEIISWILLLTGISLNTFFIGMIIVLLN